MFHIKLRYQNKNKPNKKKRIAIETWPLRQLLTNWDNEFMRNVDCRFIVIYWQFCLMNAQFLLTYVHSLAETWSINSKYCEKYLTSKVVHSSMLSFVQKKTNEWINKQDIYILFGWSVGGRASASDYNNFQFFFSKSKFKASINKLRTRYDCPLPHPVCFFAGKLRRFEFQYLKNKIL